MQNKLFVGSLPWAATDQDLEEAFSQFGEVTSAKVITDKFSGKSRGFGFVEFATDEAAQAAIDGLNESEFMGRKIFVSVARPKSE